MRVLIIEDEMGALDDLRSILAESAPDIRIAGTTESVMQSVAWLEKNPVPDLIFMDIHLSDGSAFEIFKRTAVEAPVIFTTAYDEYAIHA
ncbi:MAG: response regulator, partial [Alistipes sp.]|nr:response regulator [Alistipes sp.]